MRSFKQHINEQAKTKIPAAKFEELIVIAFNGGFKKKIYIMNMQMSLKKLQMILEIKQVHLKIQ